MKVTIVSPSKAIVTQASEAELAIVRKALTYTNTSSQHLVKRHYANHWWKQKNLDTWSDHLRELQKAVHRTLMYFDDGHYWIRPGSLPYLEPLIGVLEITNEVTYPTPKKIPWAKPLPFELYPYQEISSTNLIAMVHSNVELCTGAGKSAILLKVCRETGFRTAIIAPSKSIFLELLEKFEHHFGKGMVGRFGDGKKVLGKRFTICIGDSIANIKPETPEYEFFSGLDMICVDESHTWGAETLEEICYGVLGAIPYRMFFSGTQTRGDGSEKLLRSIIGKTVHVLTTKEAVEGGYISNHDFTVVDVESSDPNFASGDALEMKRIHFLGNSNIAHFTAKLAIATAKAYRRQTLVLVEELGQIAVLLPLLEAAGIPTAIAHSEKRAERLADLGLSKVNPTESVEKFNKGEALVLIGTSCISTGTNIYPTHATVNWVGGSSEIKTKQGAVGRTVRLGSQNPYKDRCVVKEIGKIFDFNVKGIDKMKKHLEARIICYQDSGTPIKFIKLK